MGYWLVLVCRVLNVGIALFEFESTFLGSVALILFADQSLHPRPESIH
jgi:hypothetical protein